LLPKNDIAGWLRGIIGNSEKYWEAVQKVRQHLAAHHSYRQRLAELVAMLGR